MLSNQLVLPGITLEEPTRIENPKFRFGIEIEATEFYNDFPISFSAWAFMHNKETGIIYTAIVRGERTRGEEREAIDVLKSVSIIEVNKRETESKFGFGIGSDGFKRLPKYIQEAWKFGLDEFLISRFLPTVEVDDDGNLPPKWEEIGDRLYRIIEDGSSAIGQARSLLSRGSLHDWKVTTDQSLTDSEIDGIELVSPVFDFPGPDSVWEVCDIFEDLVDLDWSCGLHIHLSLQSEPIGRYRYTLDQLKWLILKWMRIERTFMEMRDFHDLNDLNQPLYLSEDVGEILEAKDEEQLFDAANPEGRHATLNLWSLAKHGTLEFRGFKATFDSNRIYRLVQFLTEFLTDVLS